MIIEHRIKPDNDKFECISWLSNIKLVYVMFLIHKSIRLFFADENDEKRWYK